MPRIKHVIFQICVIAAIHGQPVLAQGNAPMLGVHTPIGVGDLNGDGVQDFAVTGGQIWIYLGPFNSADAPALRLDVSGYALVSTIGDVNRDGYSDLAVGFPTTPIGGELRIYWGSAQGPTAKGYRTLPAPSPYSAFGLSVAACNFLGDEALEIAVGASDESEVWIYQLAANGIPINSPNRITISEPATQFGAAVACGDIDGDGYGDLAVGAPDYNAAPIYGGAVLVYRGSFAGVLVAETLVADPANYSGRFGKMLSLAGDLNGDGRADLIAFEERRLRIYSQRKGTTGLVQSYKYTVPQLDLMQDLTSSGDLNGDQYDDLVFSVYSPSGSGRFVGVYGHATGLAHRAIEEQAAFIPWGCALVGDITGDGFGDLLLSERVSGTQITRVVAGPASYVFDSGFEFE